MYCNGQGYYSSVLIVSAGLENDDLHAEITILLAIQLSALVFSDIQRPCPTCRLQLRRVGQNLCRKQLASTCLNSKIAKESISVIESCHRSRADALQGHFQATSISNRQQPDHACINLCLSHSENSVQMHACMICSSEFSPEWLNQRMHGHRPARIRSGGCMTGNRKIKNHAKIILY
eukprot:COSAG05_NODE_912_length_6631_cov_192.387171_4_plen_177_part_00